MGELEKIPRDAIMGEKMGGVLPTIVILHIFLKDL